MSDDTDNTTVDATDPASWNTVVEKIVYVKGDTSHLEKSLFDAERMGKRYAKGGVLQGGTPVPFANGGVISSPIAFPLAGGRTGIAGEAGSEAIMPLARGPDGRLGVVARGSGGGAPITINISTPDIEGFNRSQSQVAAMIARAAALGQRNL